MRLLRYLRNLVCWPSSVVQWIVICLKWSKLTAETEENDACIAAYFFSVLWLDFLEGLSMFSSRYMKTVLSSPTPSISYPQLACMLRLKGAASFSTSTFTESLTPWQEKGIPLWCIASSCKNLLGIKNDIIWNIVSFNQVNNSTSVSHKEILLTKIYLHI